MLVHRKRSFKFPKAAPWSRYRDLTEAALDLQLTSMGITSFLLPNIILYGLARCLPHARGCSDSSWYRVGSEL